MYKSICVNDVIKLGNNMLIKKVCNFLHSLSVFKPMFLNLNLHNSVRNLTEQRSYFYTFSTKLITTTKYLTKNKRSIVIS
jgi:hypothetical protein